MLINVPVIRLSFRIDSVEPADRGWRLEGKPDFHVRHWARPGERFDIVTGEHGRHEREVDLTVTELTRTHAVVTGAGGEQLRSGDYLFGERHTESSAAGPGLSEVLGLAPSTATVDWSQVEASLGVTLPRDYKQFVGAHGSGVIDDCVIVNGQHDLIEENRFARALVRMDFGDPDTWSEEAEWPLGDAAHWTPDRADVPDWFQPGDDLVAWGSWVGSPLHLFWHVRPGIPADGWTVVLKERGPYWERFETGFTTTLAGLLTGDLQSRYLSRRLSGPHTYP
jgi:hypothetical protein